MKKLALAAVAGLSLATPCRGAGQARDACHHPDRPRATDPAYGHGACSQRRAAGRVAQHILLCGPAGDIARKDAPDTATAPQPPRDMSPRGLMRKIMESPNNTVEVCAIYLPGKGADQSVLIDGVGVAAPAAMAGAMLAENTRITSY